MRPIPSLILAAAVLACASPCLAFTTVPGSMVSGHMNMVDPDSGLESTLDSFQNPTAGSTGGGLGAFVSHLFGGDKKQDDAAPARQLKIPKSVAYAAQPVSANRTENAMMGLPNR
jgi:hypothetical protein